MKAELVEYQLPAFCDCDIEHRCCNFCLKQSPVIDTNNFLGKFSLTNIVITVTALTFSFVGSTFEQYYLSHQTSAITTESTKSEAMPNQDPNEFKQPAQPDPWEQSDPNQADPSNPADSKISNADWNNQLLVDAIKQFTAEIKSNPRNANAYMERGWAYSQGMQNTKALRDLNRAVVLSPTDGEIRVKRGWVYSELGKFQKALKDAKKAIQLEPYNYDAYDLQASVYGALGDYSLAEKSGRESIQKQMRTP